MPPCKSEPGDMRMLNMYQSSYKTFSAAVVSWYLSLNILVLRGNLITWEILRTHGCLWLVSASSSSAGLLPTVSSTCLTRSVRFSNSLGGITGARLMPARLSRAFVKACQTSTGFGQEVCRCLLVYRTPPIRN